MAEMTPAGAVAPFTLSDALLARLHAATPALTTTAVAGGRGLLVEHVLSPDEVEALLGELDAQDWIPVGLDGIARNYTPGDQIGSFRASTYSPQLAGVLWARLAPAVAVHPALTPESPTDHDDHAWEAAGVNALMRGIRYRQGGLLVPHYDAPYVASDAERTLMTVVLYLGTRGDVQGGATRFLEDPQDARPLQERDYADRRELAREDEVIGRVAPTAGSALLFWHRVLHDSEPIHGPGEKTIIRTDITYRRLA